MTNLNIKIEQPVAAKIIIPSPVTKSPHGKVPNAIPILPNKFGTKFIIEDAVPIFSFALLKSTSIPNGRAIVPVIVNGRKENKNAHALQCPGKINSKPLVIETKNKNCMSLSFDIKFFRACSHY